MCTRSMPLEFPVWWAMSLAWWMMVSTCSGGAVPAVGMARAMRERCLSARLPVCCFAWIAARAWVLAFSGWCRHEALAS